MEINWKFKAMVDILITIIDVNYKAVRRES